MNRLFKEENEERFRSYVRIKFEEHMSFEEAATAAYLDMARTMRGLASAINSNIEGKDTYSVRNEAICMMKNEYQKLTPESPEFDCWHKDLCCSLKDLYNDYGYGSMTVGRSQKWINMTLKYLALYGDNEEQEKIKPLISMFHVPVDTFIAKEAMDELGITPPITAYQKKFRKGSIDPLKSNYTWSSICSYNDYLEFQNNIRNNEMVKEKESSLHWEFDAWMKCKEEERKCK